jgi:hypothetical protein
MYGGNTFAIITIYFGFLLLLARFITHTHLITDTIQCYSTGFQMKSIFASSQYTGHFSLKVRKLPNGHTAL